MPVVCSFDIGSGRYCACVGKFDNLIFHGDLRWTGFDLIAPRPTPHWWIIMVTWPNLFHCPLAASKLDVQGSWPQPKLNPNWAKVQWLHMWPMLSTLERTQLIVATWPKGQHSYLFHYPLAASRKNMATDCGPPEMGIKVCSSNCVLHNSLSIAFLHWDLETHLFHHLCHPAMSQRMLRYVYHFST